MATFGGDDDTLAAGNPSSTVLVMMGWFQRIK